MENLLLAWEEFIRGKKKRNDVQEFGRKLMANILVLHNELASGTYHHGGYYAFKISDPKPRDIHKATVRDRLLHHAVHRHLYPFFERTFCADSYSSRKKRGTHFAINRFRTFARRLQHQQKKTVWVLKCDIRKFFASIDHTILIKVLERHIPQDKTMQLLRNIIASFSTGSSQKGLPLGNLTSQLLVNIYMNEFDQYVKHVLKAKYYVRYADDFVILSHNRKELEQMLLQIREFLRDRLALELHPNKVSITTLASGVDFLGWVHFPHHRVLRTVTKKRMFAKLARNRSKQSLNSYLGLISHGNTHKLAKQIADLRNTEKTVH